MVFYSGHIMSIQYAFPENQTYDLGVASAVLYYMKTMKT